jgi:hypothetical protein
MNDDRDRNSDTVTTMHRAWLLEGALKVLPADYAFGGLSDRQVALATIEALRSARDIRSLIVQDFPAAMLAGAPDDAVFGVFQGAIDMVTKYGLIPAKTAELSS